MLTRKGGKSGTKKYGRNAASCAAYRSAGTRQRNIARRARRRIAGYRISNTDALLRVARIAA